MADLNQDDDQNQCVKPIGERWPPLGAPSSELKQETYERTSR